MDTYTEDDDEKKKKWMWRPVKKNMRSKKTDVTSQVTATTMVPQWWPALLTCTNLYKYGLQATTLLVVCKKRVRVSIMTTLVSIAAIEQYDK